MTLLKKFNASLIKWPPPGTRDVVKGIYFLVLQDSLKGNDSWWKEMDDISKEEFLKTQIRNVRRELRRQNLLMKIK